MSPDGEPTQAQDAWESVDYCSSCHRERLHTFILWRDDNVVESECRYCLSVRERQDVGA